MQIPVITGLTERQGDSCIYCTQSVVNVLVEIYEKNLTSHNMWQIGQYIQKRKEYFADNCRYSFLILHQNSSGNFLKISCNVKSEAMLMNFFLLCYIKIHGSVFHFAWITWHHKRVPVKFWFVELHRSSECWHISSHDFKNSHSLYHLKSHQRSL